MIYDLDDLDHTFAVMIYMLCRIRILQTQNRNHVLDHAGHMTRLPPGHDIDLADHTDQGYVSPLKGPDREMEI